MDPAKDQKDHGCLPDEDYEHQQKPHDVSFVDDCGRPRIKKYSTEPRFRPNDYVFIQGLQGQTREGPYVVTHVKDNRYTLSDTRGRPFRNGATFDEKELQLQDPFA